MSSLQALIDAAPGVSARPDSVLALLDIIEDPTVGADKLIPIVEHDPGLSAGLLKLCNSPMYCFKRRIGSPSEAMVLVGNLTFARLCFTLSLEPVLHQDLPGYSLDMDTLWQHSMATAYGAAFLMSAIGRKDLRDRAFTAGLLHDIGKLVLDGNLAAATEQDPGESPQEANSGGITLDFERRKTGFDHAEVGAALIESWNFPDELVGGIRWHHDPGQAGSDRKLAQALNVANRVAHFSGNLKSGSSAIETWVQKTFDSAAFPFDSIQNLADTVANKQNNILALAMNPRL
jgi:putative nucleotidyltransferase with HDIG domain